MDPPHPVRGADFAQFEEGVTLDEFAPSVRIIGREDDSIAVRYQYYVAGPAAADEAFLEFPFRLIEEIADAEGVDRIPPTRRQYFDWKMEIFTPTTSIVYLYDLAYRVAARLPKLSTPQILTHWERTERVAIGPSGRCYARPVEALMLPLLKTDTSHSPSPGEFPPIASLFPEFDRTNPAVDVSAIPLFGYEERWFELDGPPHTTPFDERPALEVDSG